MKILITAFAKTSAQLLVQDSIYNTLLLPSDKVQDAEKLFSALEKEDYDYVFSFGQRPNIKNKVHIETTARKGMDSVETKWDTEELKDLFIQNKIAAKVSHNAGTSYCNSIYYNGLTYIAGQGLKTKMVFVHIPFIQNIDDITSFRKGVYEAIREFINKKYKEKSQYFSSFHKYNVI